MCLLRFRSPHLSFCRWGRGCPERLWDLLWNMQQVSSKHRTSILVSWLWVSPMAFPLHSLSICHHWAESLQAAQIWQTYAGCFLETNRSLAISSNSPFMWPHINIRLLLLVSVKITKNKKQTWLDGNATYLKLKTKNLKRQKASGKVGKIQILWQKKKC